MRWAFLGFALAMAATPAPAQVLDTLTLYGRVDAVLESVEARGQGVVQPRRLRINDQASRFGVRGTEHLGGDLTGWFQLETNFPVDAPTRFFGTRNSGVGFSGPWGTILLGRWDSAFDASQVLPIDPFSDLGIAAMSGAAVHQGNFARRDQNSVQYWSPRVTGWRTRISVQARQDDVPTSVSPYNYGWMIAHVDDESYVSIAFERHKDQLELTTTPGSHEEGRGIAASQQFGPVRASAQYGTYRRTGAVTQRSYLLGLQSVHGPHELLGSYQDSRNGGLVAAAAQPRCNLLAVGYRYRLSLHSFLMAQYAYVKNKVGNLCNFGNSPLAITGSQDLRGMGIAMRMGF